jgi:hypothetical protein
MGKREGKEEKKGRFSLSLFSHFHFESHGTRQQTNQGWTVSHLNYLLLVSYLARAFHPRVLTIFLEETTKPRTKKRTAADELVALTCVVHLTNGSGTSGTGGDQPLQPPGLFMHQSASQLSHFGTC